MSIKFLVCDMPTIDKNASSVPGLINGKWLVSLGQNVRQLKKVVGAFPIVPCSKWSYSYCYKLRNRKLCEMVKTGTVIKHFKM